MLMTTLQLHYSSQLLHCQLSVMTIHWNLIYHQLSSNQVDLRDSYLVDYPTSLKEELCYQAKDFSTV